MKNNLKILVVISVILSINSAVASDWSCSAYCKLEQSHKRYEKILTATGDNPGVVLQRLQDLCAGTLIGGPVAVAAAADGPSSKAVREDSLPLIKDACVRID